MQGDPSAWHRHDNLPEPEAQAETGLKLKKVAAVPENSGMAFAVLLISSKVMYIRSGCMGILTYAHIACS